MKSVKIGVFYHCKVIPYEFKITINIVEESISVNEI